MLIVEGHGEKKTKPVGTIAFVYLSNNFKKNTICYLIWAHPNLHAGHFFLYRSAAKGLARLGHCPKLLATAYITKLSM